MYALKTLKVQGFISVKADRVLEDMDPPENTIISEMSEREIFQIASYNRIPELGRHIIKSVQ